MGKAPVLIADPDSRVASLAAHGLRREGFEVLVANRGEDALAMLASAPSLVFCEVGLPGVDGFSLCENARKEPLTREVPFLLLTRSHERAERDRCAAVGANDLLVKPLYVRDLITLARLFAGRPAGQATIEGELKELPLFYLLRALTSGNRSGEVDLPKEKASVHFRDGRVVEANAEELSGEAAITRLLLLSEGPFFLRLGPVLLRGSTSYSLREMVTHDEPRRRRFEKAVALMGGPQTRLTIDFNALTRELPRLPASVEKIVRLFDGERTLGEALRVSDLEEVTTAEAVLRLRMTGVLVPVSETAGAKGEVKLFEPRPDEAILEMKKLFPEGSPNPTELPEATPRDVRDWFQEMHKTAYQELLAVKDGGWVAQPAAEASKQLLEAAGEGAKADIDRQIAALEGPQAPSAPTPTPSAQTPAPAPVVPAAAVVVPAPTPAAVTPAPAPAAAAPAPAARPVMPRPIPLSAAPRRKPSGDFDEEEFFNSEPTLGEGPTRLAKVLVVVLFLALGVTLGIVIRWPRRTVAPPPPPAPLVLPAPKPVEPTPVTPTPPTEPGPAAALSDDAGEEPESDAAVAAAGDAAAVAIADSGVPATDASAALEPETPGVDVNALIAAGSTLYNKGQPAAAIKPLEQAAAAAPQSASIQILLSEARLDAGKLDAAEQAARRAVELAPEEPRAHLALGNVLQISGRNAQARGAYETYLKLAPKGEHANEVREILKSLR